MKPVIIVQARMTSTRLPGKVLKRVLGKTLLEYQLERLGRVREADRVIIATTDSDDSLPLVELCSRLGVSCFRGPELDVLGRYYQAAEWAGATEVVRINSDCPVIDPAVADRVIGFFTDHRGEFDYVSNILKPSYPVGMHTEIFTFAALETAYNEANLAAEREHVTPYIYNHPERFRLANVACEKDLSHHRWTVDTPEDLERITYIIESLYPRKPDFSMEDVLALYSGEIFSQAH